MGNRITQHPAIDEPDEGNVVEVLRQVKESLEIGRRDRRGDPLDRWATLRDLNELGLTSLTDASSVAAGGPGPGFGPGGADPGDILPLPPDGSGEFLPPYDPNVSRPLPDRPQNVRCTPVWDGIMVKWDVPNSGPTVDWIGAVVWMSATNQFNQGNFLGYASVNFFIHDHVGLSGGGYANRWYWVAWYGNEFSTGGLGGNPHKIPGVGNQSDWSPHSYETGAPGNTAIDPAYALRVLQAQITESQIYATLNQRINLVDYDSKGKKYTEYVQDRILAVATGATDDIYAAIAETASAKVINGKASGEYVLRIDANGYIVGFGFSAMANIDAPGQYSGATSTFVIVTDKFAIVRPGAKTGEPRTIPFVIGTVDGVVTVGINGQLVVDGTITAKKIDAHTIGANEINAVSVWAGIMTTPQLIANTMRTGPSPQTRVEINGVGSAGELYPMWYGQGQVSGQVSSSSTPYFYLAKDGTMVLAGELRVTGAGKFYIGRNEVGEYRVELGGYTNNTIMWVGTGPVNTSKDSPNWIMWIDKAGNAKFRGDLEARFVSGEISRVTPINDYTTFNIPRKQFLIGGKMKYPQNTGEIPPEGWTLVGEWMLPESVFEPHLPYLTVSANFYGLGVRAAAIRISFRSSAGSWQQRLITIADIFNYGGDRTFIASAPARLPGVTYFRMEVAPFDAGSWSGEAPLTTTYRIGFIHGIR